jgi:cytochrome b involved in lipid metabolism
MKKLSFSLLALMLSLTLTACGEEVEAPGDSDDGSSEAITDDQPATSQSPEGFILAEVAEHDSAEDCWQVIDGKVHDVTEYVASGEHPGGEAILAGCGKDATEMFFNRQDGTSHGPGAVEMLEDYYIGDLVE